MSPLATTLKSLADAGSVATLAMPPGIGRDIATILTAALGVSSSLAKGGASRDEIVRAIRRVPDLHPRIAAQDAAVDAAVEAKPSRDDEPTAEHGVTGSGR